MSKFFDKLESERLLSSWASTLDWLFDDTKFSETNNWNSGYVGQFTKRVKKLKYLSNKDKRITYGKVNCGDFPNQNSKSRRKRTPYIVMKSGDCFARDLIRHIRNGIAHGQTNIYKFKSDLYIEIMDYSDKSKSPEKQTAFICIPLFYIVSFNAIYNEINKSIMNTKPKDRMATKKYK